MNVSILTGALFLLPVFAAAQEPVLSTDRAIAEIAAGREDDALATVVALLGKSATDQTLHRARVNLLLALERPGPAMVCARLFANALPQGLERASLEVFADRSLAFYRSMESPALLTRLGALRAEGNPARMLAIVRVLEGRVDEGREKPRRILGEFYGSNHRFFDRRKAVAYLTGYRKTATDRRERIEIYQRLLTLENGQKLKVVVPVSSSGSVEKRVLAELAAGDNEVAFKSVQSLLAKDPTNPELLRVQMNLQLGLGHQMDAIESARDLADALPKGLERTSLQAVASLAASMYERMPSSDIFERLDVQRRRRDPARMVAMIRVLEAHRARSSASSTAAITSSTIARRPSRTSPDISKPSEIQRSESICTRRSWSWRRGASCPQSCAPLLTRCPRTRRRSKRSMHCSPKQRGLGLSRFARTRESPSPRRCRARSRELFV